MLESVKEIVFAVFLCVLTVVFFFGVLVMNVLFWLAYSCIFVLSLCFNGVFSRIIRACNNFICCDQG